MARPPDDDWGLPPRTKKLAVELVGLILMVGGAVCALVGNPLGLAAVALGCGMLVDPTRDRTRLLDLVARWLDRR